MQRLDSGCDHHMVLGLPTTSAKIIGKKIINQTNLSYIQDTNFTPRHHQASISKATEAI
jgi:hypothetical protein